MKSITSRACAMAIGFAVLKNLKRSRKLLRREGSGLHRISRVRGGTMRSRSSTWITAITLFAALALPVSLAAQHRRYKIIDLGTLGGPNSSSDSTSAKPEQPGRNYRFCRHRRS